jgi:ABC-2 type transport system ATP-binding protein
LLHDPKVLVIDEPMVGLDPRSVRLIKDLLRAKSAAGQITFMSTHLLAIAEEIADRVGIVDQGQLKFLGTIDELRQRLSTHERSLEQLYLSFTAPRSADLDDADPIAATSATLGKEPTP